MSCLACAFAVLLPVSGGYIAPLLDWLNRTEADAIEKTSSLLPDLYYLRVW